MCAEYHSVNMSSLISPPSTALLSAPNEQQPRYFSVNMINIQSGSVSALITYFLGHFSTLQKAIKKQLDKYAWKPRYEVKNSFSLSQKNTQSVLWIRWVTIPRVLNFQENDIASITHFSSDSQDARRPVSSPRWQRHIPCRALSASSSNVFTLAGEEELSHTASGEAMQSS